VKAKATKKADPMYYVEYSINWVLGFLTFPVEGIVLA